MVGRQHFILFDRADFFCINNDRRVKGTIYFFTLGLLGVGWLIDLFLIPSMDRQADLRSRAGPINYTFDDGLILRGSISQSKNYYSVPIMKGE